MARQQTRTTGGSYQNPTEGIVDYGAFARGFASTFRMPQEEEIEEENNNFNINVFSGSRQNEATNGVSLAQDSESMISSAKNNLMALSKKFGKAKSPEEKNKLASQITGRESSYNNKTKYETILKEENGVYSYGASDYRIIDENGDKTEVDGAAWARIKKFTPNLIKDASIVAKDGKTKYGFMVNYNNKDVFLNFGEMSEDWENDNIKLAFNKQQTILNSIDKKNGIVREYNRKPTYYESSEANITVTNEDGTKKTVTVTDAQKYINDKFYIDADDNAVIFAEQTFKNQFGEQNEDAFYQLQKTNFTFSEDIQNKLQQEAERLANQERLSNNKKEFDVSTEQGKRNLKAASLKFMNYKNKKIASQLSDDLKITMLRDNLAEEWKINIASAGYIRGKNGRAQSKNEVQYNKSTKTKTEDVDTGVASVAKLAASKLKNPGIPIKDMTATGVRDFVNLLEDATMGTKAFVMEDGKAFFERNAMNTIDPTTNENYTKQKASELWNLTMTKYPKSGLIYIDKGGRVIGLDIDGQENIAGLAADLLGYKESDKLTFIENFDKPNLPE